MACECLEMSSLLKIDGRTVRGRQWRELNSSGKPLKQGILHLKKVCSTCNVSPEDKEKIECMSCHQLFHITCLLTPVDGEFLKLIAENPTVFWFCPGCISCKVPEAIQVETSALTNDTSMSDVVLQSTLMNFKKEILTLVSETMESKLSVISDLVKSKTNSSAHASPPTSSVATVDGNAIGSNANPVSWADMCREPDNLNSTPVGIDKSSDVGS